jgi:glycosyltransferase involved in cell wall biosynthesis
VKTGSERHNPAAWKKASVPRNLNKQIPMKLSVIIPCFNEEQFIGVQLEALVEQEWPEGWELIVSDNGSTDGTVDVVQRYMRKYSHIRLVNGSQRRGPAHARNAGARTAAGEALAFLDADDVAAPGWVTAIGRALQQYDFVASRFDNERLNPQWVRKGRIPPQRDGLSWLDVPPFLSHAGGCGLGIKRVVHERVGGFNESWPVCEDADYCLRVQLAGTPLHFATDALVHIRYHESSREIYRQARNWGRETVRLYKVYRTNNSPSFSVKEGIWKWKALISRLPAIHDKASLAKAIWELGWRFGRLQGSLKYWIVCL